MKLLTEALGKRYDARWALRDVSLQWSTGIVGLEGPNGAGKTTLMRILATLTPQTEGRVTWNGRDTRDDGLAVRRVLGYVSHCTCTSSVNATTHAACFSQSRKVCRSRLKWGTISAEVFPISYS